MFNYSNIPLNDKAIADVFMDENDKMTNIGVVFGQKTVSNKFPELKEYIDTRYADSDCLKESVYRMKHNIEIRPVCKTCGGHVTFNIQRRSNGSMFPSYCNASCQMKDKKQQELHNNTCLEKYGSVNNIKKQRQTKKERYDDEYYNNGKKRDQTNLAKFGFTCPLMNEEVKKRTEETNINRYGYKHPQSSQKVKDKIRNSVKRAAERKTKKKRSEEAHKAAIARSIENANKSEKEAYKILINIFGKENVKYQHYDAIRYPYDCDFYIKHFDLFIELQANHFIHGSHPFNQENKNDLEQLHKLYMLRDDKIQRTGSATGYDDAIRTWTKEDIDKRIFAKRSGIKWIEFFTVKELKESLLALREHYINIKGYKQIDREGIF